MNKKKKKKKKKLVYTFFDERHPVYSDLPRLSFASAFWFLGRKKKLKTYYLIGLRDTTQFQYSVAKSHKLLVLEHLIVNSKLISFSLITLSKMILISQKGHKSLDTHLGA